MSSPRATAIHLQDAARLRSRCSALVRGSGASPLRRLVILCSLSCLMSLAGASAAIASKAVDSFFGNPTATTGTTGGLFFHNTGATGIGGVAVRESTGDVYVVDRGNHRIQQFDADGNFIRAWGQDVIVNTGTPANGNGTGFEVCDTTTAPANTAADCKAGIATASTGGAMSAPQGIAINQATGHVYVTEQGFLRVEEFTAEGQFVRAWGQDVIVNTGTPANGNGTGFEVCDTTAASPNTAADCKTGVTGGTGGAFATTFNGHPTVVPAGPLNAGNVVVADPGNRRVQEFTANGAFVRTFGFDVAAAGVDNSGAGFEVCTAGGSGAANCKVAANAGPGVGQFASSQPQRVAADSSGAIYASESSGANFRVQKFAPFAAYVTPAVFAPDVLTGTAASSAPSDLAVDPTTDRVFVAKAFPANTGSPPAAAAERRVLELSSAGALADTHMTMTATAFNPAINSVNGLALRSSPSRLYVSSATVAQRVYVLDDDGPTPAIATIDPPTGIDTHSATFSGQVNPNGGQLTTAYRFEYAKQGSDSWTPIPASDTDLGNGTSPIPVGPHTVNDLEAGQAYKVRLATTKQFNPTVYTPEETFTTPAAAPEVTLDPVTKIKATSATLNGTVNPNNNETAWYFEYGTSTDYGAKIPVDGVTAGAGGQTVSVWRRLSGLEPATTYHYRLVATSSQGTTATTDQTFVTPPYGAAPEGRGWEMVTFPEKAGRRASNPTEGGPVEAPTVGAPSPDGESVLLTVYAASLNNESQGTTGFDTARYVRDAGGWRQQPLYWRTFASLAYLPLHNFLGATEDQSVVGIRPPVVLFPEHVNWPLASGGLAYTRFFDGIPAWADAPDSSTWESSTSQSSGGSGGIIGTERFMLFSNDGRQAYAASPPGLLGPGDPSFNQPGPAVYRRDLTTGEKELFSTCTDGAVVPARDDAGTPAVPGDDTVSTQPCADGAITSAHGAALGGGDVWSLQTSTLRARQSALGTGLTAVSADGETVFLTTPDPRSPALATSVNSPIVGCTAATGSASVCQSQVFVSRRTSSGSRRVRWISRPAIPGQQVGLLGRGAAFEAASRDGRMVFFRTNAPLTVDDPNGAPAPPPPGGVTTGTASSSSWDLYRYELPSDPDADPAGGTLTRITAGPGGDADPNTSCSELGTGTQASACNVGGTAGQAAGAGGVVRYHSDDGQRVYFVTASPIAGVDNAPPAGSAAANVAGGTPVNVTTRNLYAYDAAKPPSERWKFIARLPFSTSTLAGCAATHLGWGLQANAPLGSGGFTSNGMQLKLNGCVHGAQKGASPADVLTFTTDQQLTADDTDAAFDVYAYDSETHALSRASAPQGGAGGASYACAPDVECNADLGIEPAGSNRMASFYRGATGLRHFNVTTDGAVLFESRRQLVPEDVNGSRMDTYQWQDGELSLVSPGTSDDDSYFSGNSDDGEDVFVYTSAPLDPSREIDADFDVYDARRGGGFPPLTERERCDLMADRCQGSGAAAVGDDTMASSPSGSGNAMAGPRRALALGGLSPKARRKAARSGRLSLKVRTAVRGKVSITVRARLGKRTSRIGGASKRVAEAGVVTIGVRLSRAARRHLRSGKKLRLTIEARQPGARTRTTSILLPGVKS